MTRNQTPSRGTVWDDTAVSHALSLYREGWFPMGEGARTEWVQPRRRSVLPLGVGAGLRVSRSLRQRVRSGKFSVRCDTAFGAVIRSCAGPRVIEGQPELQTWINEDVIGLFEAFHRAGHAHSVEAWIDGEPGGPRLVGGLYGVAIGKVFCGESMFSRPEIGGRDASKVCLVHLVGHLLRGGFTLLDSQIANPHTESLGFVEWPAGIYISTLRGSGNGTWLTWDAEAALTEVAHLVS